MSAAQWKNRKVRTAALVVAAGVVASGAHYAAQPLAHAAEMGMPEPTATGVLGHLKKEDYQKRWKFFPGKQRLYKGREPHGMLLTTYVNEAARAALERKADVLPYGSILVKENYTPDNNLAAVTVMYKVRGYNPEHGDWFWLKQEAGGKVAASGKVAGCQACHGPSKRDYILTPLP